MSNTKTPSIKDFKPFLGYGPEDFEAAKQFYRDIGFSVLWENDTVCTFDTGIGHRFLVTLHHGLDRSSAGMMQLWVDDVDTWQAHLAGLYLPEKYPGVKVAEPTVTEWGWRILYVWDPGGYLWHIGEPATPENKAFFDDAKWVS